MTRKLGKSRAAFRLNTRRAYRKAYSNVSSLGRRRHKRSRHKRSRHKRSRHKRSRHRRGGTTPVLTPEDEAAMRAIESHAAEEERLAVNAICPHCNRRYDGKKYAGETDSDDDKPRIEYIHGQNRAGQSTNRIGAMLICKQPTCRKVLGAISIT